MNPSPEPSPLRRLNHLVGEDFYFISYCMLVSLQVCCAKGAAFRDHRKLGHIVHFVSDSRLLSILDRSRDAPVASPVDRELLFGTYTKAELLKREVHKLLISLDRRGLVYAEPSTTAVGAIDVTLTPEFLASDLASSPVFETERQNAAQLRALVPRLSVLTLETFLNRVYVARGVRAWAL